MADGRSCKVGHAMKRQLALLLMRRIRVEGPLRDPEVTATPLALAPRVALLLTLILTLTLNLTLTLTLAPPLAPPLSR